MGEDYFIIEVKKNCQQGGVDEIPTREGFSFDSGFC